MRMSSREIKPIAAQRAPRFETREGLLDATRAQCKAELGDPFEALGRASLWELQLGSKATKTVAQIEALVSELEMDQLADWVAGGGEADGTRTHEDGVSYMSDLHIPAYEIARTLRAAIDKTKDTLNGRALAEFAKQFPDMSDRAVAVRALVDGYEPNLSGSDLSTLTTGAVTKRVTNAVRDARKSG